MSEKRDDARMTDGELRDWFAGQALTAVIEAEHVQQGYDLTYCADLCYKIADALLVERSKSKRP